MARGAEADEVAIRMAIMLDLLLEARPMMEAKCCHWDWCIERRGIVFQDDRLGWTEIQDGMHPGCGPYRRWLDRLARLTA
jgi:hypothetical protein